MKKTFEVNVTSLLPEKVYRELDEHQELCPECLGLGLLRKDDSHGSYITICDACHGRNYVERCPQCKATFTSGRRHKCPESQEERMRQREKFKQEQWERAEKVTYAEALARFEQVFIEDAGYFPTNWIPDHIAMAQDEGKTIPRIWGTFSRTLSLNAQDWVDDALENLYESACVDQRDMNELERYVDMWCQRPSVVESTKTYFKDDEVAILPPDEEMLTASGGRVPREAHGSTGAGGTNGS
jgi:hypothetical protein